MSRTRLSRGFRRHRRRADGGRLRTSAAEHPGPAGAEKAAPCTPDNPSLHERGRLTVATDSPAYEPWFDSNTPSNGKGFESAVAYAVAEKLGFARDQVKWVVEPFAHSYAPGKKAFDFDINQISITPQRESRRFLHQLLHGQSGHPDARRIPVREGHVPERFKDAEIGVQVATTSYQAVLDQIKPSKRPSVFSTTKDEVTALRNGQIDAIVTDLPTVFYLAGAELENGEIVGQFGYAGGTPRSSACSCRRTAGTPPASTGPSTRSGRTERSRGSPRSGSPPRRTSPS